MNVINIDGKWYRQMTDMESVNYIWGDDIGLLIRCGQIIEDFEPDDDTETVLRQLNARFGLKEGMTFNDLKSQCDEIAPYTLHEDLPDRMSYSCHKHLLDMITDGVRIIAVTSEQEHSCCFCYTSR